MGILSRWVTWRRSTGADALRSGHRIQAATRNENCHTSETIGGQASSTGEYQRMASTNGFKEFVFWIFAMHWRDSMTRIGGGNADG